MRQRSIPLHSPQSHLLLFCLESFQLISNNFKSPQSPSFSPAHSIEAQLFFPPAVRLIVVDERILLHSQRKTVFLYFFLQWPFPDSAPISVHSMPLSLHSGSRGCPLMRKYMSSLVRHFARIAGSPLSICPPLGAPPWPIISPPLGQWMRANPGGGGLRQINKKLQVFIPVDRVNICGCHQRRPTPNLPSIHLRLILFISNIIYVIHKTKRLPAPFSFLAAPMKQRQHFPKESPVRNWQRDAIKRQTNIHRLGRRFQKASCFDSFDAPDLKGRRHKVGDKSSE